MTKLDETGLAAARKEAHELGLEALADPWAPYLGSIITAYLAATRTSDALRDLQRLGQECEGERRGMSEPPISPEDAEFFRRMEQSKRDHRAHVWATFVRAAHAALSVGVTEMRFDREAFMGIKASLPREHFPGHGDIRNGDIRLFGVLWVGVEGESE